MYQRLTFPSDALQTYHEVALKNKETGGPRYCMPQSCDSDRMPPVIFKLTSVRRSVVPDQREAGLVEEVKPAWQGDSLPPVSSVQALHIKEDLPA